MGNRSMPENAEWQHYMDIGLLELKQGSIFAARINFERALKEAQTLKDSTCIGLALLKLAEAHHTSLEYSDAENRYRQAIEIFEAEPAADSLFESKTGLAYLYLDWEKYGEASKLGNASEVLDKIESLEWDPDQVGKLALVKSEVLMHQGQYTGAGKLLAHVLESVDRKSPLHLYIKKAKAYSSFRNGSPEEAKEEYKEALKLASELNSPHEEMLIYQDLMFMDHELGAFATPNRERRERSREKQDNNYTRIERYHSVALNCLRKKDYQRAYIYFSRENRAYRRAGNLFGQGFADNLASLFSESQEYEKALRCYIKLGDTGKIQQLSTAVMEWIDSGNIHGLFYDLLKELEKAPVMERTGIAAALGSLFEISPDELLTDIVENLLDLTNEEYSFSRNRDVKRTALESLENYIRGQRVPEQVIDKVIDQLISISDHEESFVRENVAKCFNAFPSMIPDPLQEKVSKHMSTWADREDADYVKRTLELSIANLAFSFENPWKEQLVATLKAAMPEEQNATTNELLGYLAWLGEYIPEAEVSSALDSMMNKLDAQANYTEKGTKSLWVGLQPLVNMKKYIPYEFKGKLIEKMILSLKNEHNLMVSKQLIIQTSGEISSEFDSSLQSKFWDAIFVIADEGLNKVDSGNHSNESSLLSGFAGLADVISESIYALAKIYSVSNENERATSLNSVLLRAASSKEPKIRQSAALSFQYLETLTLESQLTIFSLLFDVDDVAGRAVQSVAKLSDKKWNKTVIAKVIEKIILHADEGKLGTRGAAAYALNQLSKRNGLPGEIKEKIQRAREKLSRDKFYRVKREVSYGDG